MLAEQASWPEFNSRSLPTRKLKGQTPPHCPRPPCTHCGILCKLTHTCTCTHWSDCFKSKNAFHETFLKNVYVVALVVLKILLFSIKYFLVGVLKHSRLLVYNLSLCWFSLYKVYDCFCRLKQKTWMVAHYHDSIVLAHCCLSHLSKYLLLSVVCSGKNKL